MRTAPGSTPWPATSQSVNIKERLDFSCAVFDAEGELVANAPHLPVHLGSMGESIETVIRQRAGTMRPGDVYVLNAPPAVAKAAVLYVFRTLIDDDIPLNAGCLKPLDIRIPEGSMLRPRWPAAVVAGNVETSQAITDALYGAVGVMAAAQGTMNNFTFGDEQRQYDETICGGSGSGAGADFDGTDAVHTHMTNTRLTDPEVPEWRFPVLLRDFHICRRSGGDGQHRGGNGVVRSIEFREPMTAVILSNRRRVPPFGLEGGDPGQCGKTASSGQVARSNRWLQPLAWR